MKGKAEKWLPEILEKLPQFSLEQDQVQNLIWQVLTGAQYDDLSKENQRILNLFYKNAFFKFGNSIFNNIADAVIESVVPQEVSSSIDEFKDLKEKAQSLQDDFSGLEKLFSPFSKRNQPIPVGWMRMKEGYLIKVTSNGYPETRIDIYVPVDGRSPQAKKAVKLATLIALPSVGQRLALSHKLNIPARTANNQYCKKLSDFKPKNCHELTDQDRESILKLADPANFSKSRYESPPDSSRPIEAETDCSRFTQQIYERAGMDYLYFSTSTFQCLSVFNEVDQTAGKPGDLVLFNGHIGILSKSGRIISATRGGPGGRSRLKSDDPNFLPSITELPMGQFGKGKILRWRCP